MDEIPPPPIRPRSKTQDKCGIYPYIGPNLNYDNMPKFTRNPVRQLPDGMIVKVFPFHFSLEGAESRILCRDEQDYDAFVKILALCSKRKNVIVVVYVVVSNHTHVVILAESQDAADAFGAEVKRMYSMYYSRKYKDRSALKGLDSKAIFIDSDWYLRNAISYVVRNAMDNGATSVAGYKWSGYRAMFCEGKIDDNQRSGCRYVRSLTRRERRSILHTDEDLDGVRWLINGQNELEPVSICDWRYLEAAFNNDQAFFMKQIGTVNLAEMGQKLITAPRTFQCDNDFLVSANEVSQRWFKTEIHDLSIAQKARLLMYVYHSFRTSPQQLARIFELPLQKVCEWLELPLQKKKTPLPRESA